MTVFSWVATALVVAIVVSFVGYLTSLRRLPLDIERELPVYNRLGQREPDGGTDRDKG